METTLLCSVIIPVFNGEEYILKCIESLINSEHENNIEIIIIDDGSTDKTVKIVRSFFKNYRNIRIIEQENKGPCFSRNNGMKLAKGKYILFVDSDDILSEHFWPILIPLLESDKYDTIFFGLKRFTKEGEEYKGGVTVQPSIFEISRQELEHLKACTLYYDSEYSKKKNPLFGISISTTGGCCWRRSIQADNNIWWDNCVRIHTDGIFNLQMLYHCKHTAYISQPLYFYRISDASISNRSRDHAERLFAQRNQAARTILNELYGLSMNDTQSEYIQRYFASLVFQIGVIMERDIFSKKVNLSLSQKRQRFAELKDFYGPQGKVSLRVLSDHEKKILALYKKSFLYNYFYFLSAKLYHTVGGIIKGRK